MALFNRDYDRDYGYRGGSAYGASGYGNRDMGGGAAGGLRRGWNRMTNGVRDAMDAGGYDRDYGNSRGGMSAGTGWGGTSGGYSGSGYSNSGYDRDMGGRSWWADGAWNQDRDLMQHQDDRDYTYRGNPGANLQGGLGYRGGGYDADYGNRGMRGSWSGYDRDMGLRDMGARDMDEGRWQTDNGDPFGDRQNHTPIRSMRGGFRRGYDRDTMDAGGGGYRGGMNRGYDSGFNNRPYNRGYDSGWF